MAAETDRPALWRVVVVVEDPGAVNFLAPLVDRLFMEGIPTLLLGLGVGAGLLRERGYAVDAPPDPSRASEFILQVRPSLVVTGTSENPATPALPLVHAARAARVPTVGVVDASINAAFRFRGLADSPLAYAPDWLMVPDEWTATAFAALGFPAERMRLVGNPARDLARRRGLALREKERAKHGSTGAPKGPLRVVFVSELSDGLDVGQYQRSDAYTLIGRGRSQSRSAVVIEEFLDACAILQDIDRLAMTLVLRLHPKQERSDLGPLCDEFDEVSIGGDPLAIVATSDLVVGMSSMLLVQADDFGVPCLAVLPRLVETTWLPEVAAGRIPCVTTRATLLAELRRLLDRPRARWIGRAAAPPSVNPVAQMLNCLAEAARTIAPE